MRTMTVILTTAFILLNSVVHASPASTFASQLIYPASNLDAAAFFAAALNATALNGTALNETAPLPPYPTQQCGVYPPAPLQDCINALIQFPFSSGGGEFHPWRPHDPDPEHGLGQARKSGQCRVFINLLDKTQPVEWFWTDLANSIWGMLDSCTENKGAPTAQWITSGDLQIHLLDNWVPDEGFRISVRKIQVEDEARVGVT